MARKLKNILLCLLSLSLLVNLSLPTFASTRDMNVNTVDVYPGGPPTEFKADATPEEIVAEIEAYYNSLSLTRTGEKWGESETVWDGEQGYYVTTRFWVAGSNISSTGIVGRAQTNAVKAKYGSVSSSYDYKLETTQHITESATQIQGYITVSAEATCYGRR